MKILLTGATGYIGKRLLIELLNLGHEVICCVRDKNRFSHPPAKTDQITILEVDFLDKSSLEIIPTDIDGAFYLMHSMSSSGDYEKLETESAINFKEIINKTKVQHVVYLSGIVNEKLLSKHLSSRKQVENELAKGNYHFTALRAGIIIGSGSASFEIIRDLVEKLPVMITPKWLHIKCQPIGINDVIKFLTGAILNPKTYDNNFDIGGPDIISYKDMLLGFAKVRKLKRYIFTVPVMTPKLSSYWLYFVTSTSYKLASALVSSMKVEVICRDNDINELLGIVPVNYIEALKNTFSQIQEHQFISSWKDSLVSGELSTNLSEHLNVPVYGCFKDKRNLQVSNLQDCQNKIWRIGGDNGWYFANWLWRLRGFIDRCFGGVGLRRGRSDPDQLYMGYPVDFWRVLYASRSENRLLLFAEMKLPGEAWLEFKIEDHILCQTATFRPKGLLGRLYWYAIYPFHVIIFKGLINQLVQ